MSNDRRLASRLVKHAASVLPPSLAPWGAAMQHEIAHIHPDRDALKWALGCVATSYRQRIAAFNATKNAIIRWVLAVVIASWAIRTVFAARYFYLKAIPWPGSEPGAGDSGGFITALIRLSSWPIPLDAAAGVLYIVAACELVRRNAKSLPALVAGTALNAVGCSSQLLIAFNEYSAAITADILQRICLTYALQGCVAVLLWHGFSRDREIGSRS